MGDVWARCPCFAGGIVAILNRFFYILATDGQVFDDEIPLRPNREERLHCTKTIVHSSASIDIQLEKQPCNFIVFQKWAAFAEMAPLNIWCRIWLFGKREPTHQSNNADNAFHLFLPFVYPFGLTVKLGWLSLFHLIETLCNCDTAMHFCGEWQSHMLIAMKVSNLERCLEMCVNTQNWKIKKKWMSDSTADRPQSIRLGHSDWVLREWVSRKASVWRGALHRLRFKLNGKIVKMYSIFR